MPDPETVWTSRRALLLVAGRWTPGRLRLSDRALRFTAHDGEVVEVAAAEARAVRLVGRPRRVLLLETPDGPLRLRCFAAPAVAALLRRV
ncbi:hypothetical protein [Amnibacterium setariae]|uniref:hypothetical protein n=1 Tax=Amnibacterium setariae TaxID=2306585 RepID=UPI001314AAFF|nr:hypothetical protein [Amnibacterium setariae]